MNIIIHNVPANARTIVAKMEYETKSLNTFIHRFEPPLCVKPNKVIKAVNVKKPCSHYSSVIYNANSRLNFFKVNPHHIE